MCRSAYPDITALLITAMPAAANGSRVRLWKWELQQFATRTGLTITVCNFPPGTSNWNKIEHRLVSHIAMNWRGKPLVDLVTIVTLIGDTTTDARLHVRSDVDPGHYPMGVTITDKQMAQLQLEPHSSIATGTTPFGRAPATTESIISSQTLTASLRAQRVDRFQRRSAMSWI
ncbi:MAG: hypothetical protein Q8K82_19385 [Gemmatimonadaceae bacterium]|nr:hypothetical protein [Gemmatimonadaceae bacterium]